MVGNIEPGKASGIQKIQSSGATGQIASNQALAELDGIGEGGITTASGQIGQEVLSAVRALAK